MPPRFNLPTALAAPLVLLSTLSSGQVIDGSDYNKPSGGPPASYFQATSTMPVAALQTAATSLSKVSNNAVYNYKLSAESKQMSTIYTDWAGFSGGSAVVWTADMDVDCDGINYKCDGNKDGQALTDWGALSAYAVPFIVIPQEYVAPNQGAIPGNNVAAIICNGKMFYGILGDTNGNDPQVTGEASWLLARTCFPDEDLRGSSGHTDADVTYILFTGSHAVLASSAMNKHYITDFGALRSLGDRLVNALLFNLGLPGTTPPEDSGEGSLNPAQTQPQAPPPPPPPPSSTNSASPSDQDSDPDSDCGWPGHCEDSPCSTDDECSDDLVCSDGECTEQDGADDADDEGTDDDDSVDRGGCGS
ncbi:fungal chitosanase of glycosyl hydrolase group 75-domain-containing protein [Aspergillus pseudoustus]|uniref:Endo-chitosanase n=1 Tax=Aspergillus pseudoustus TaxID=1810923 RepID=A0ABR4IJF7_9EURO